MLAWSTPGAALLASTGAVDGGWPAAVGAFLLVGALILLTALWPRLGDLIAAIPRRSPRRCSPASCSSCASHRCTALATQPALVGPVVVAWLLLLRFAPRWAVPGAFVVTVAAIGIWLGLHGGLTARCCPGPS